MPRPHYAATILPGDPPELIAGIGPGLQVWVVVVSFTSISIRVGERAQRLEPLDERHRRE
jgi:hypothetical protein